MHLEQIACGSRLPPPALDTPVPRLAKFLTEARRWPLPTLGLHTRRAGAHRHGALFHVASGVGTSGVSKVGEGPRSAGTRCPLVRARRHAPRSLCAARANHSQHMDGRIAPLCFPCPAVPAPCPGSPPPAHTYVPLACLWVPRHLVQAVLGKNGLGLPSLAYAPCALPGWVGGLDG